MFQALDQRCVKPPRLCTSNTDPESLRRERERDFRHGLNMAPFLCADVARQWQIERQEAYWARMICAAKNVSAVRSHVLAYLQDDWFFPQIYPGPFDYRLAAKVGLEYAIPDHEFRRLIAASNPQELTPWI